MSSEGLTLHAGLLRRGVRAAVLALVAGAGWWALGPVRLPELTRVAAIEPLPTRQTELAAWDVQAFRTPIWVAPPAPTPEPLAVTSAPPPPPPPRNLQLLAIVLKDGAYRAVIYDQDQDRLFTVSTGEPIAGRTVADVNQTSITLGDGPTQTRLVLDPDRARSIRGPDSSERMAP